MMSWNSSWPELSWLATPLGTCSTPWALTLVRVWVADAWHLQLCSKGEPSLTQLPNSGFVIILTKDDCPSRHLRKAPHE